MGTRFSIVVGAFAVVFSGLILYLTWSSTRSHLEELTALQAELALEFDLAIHEYATETIRPEMEKRIGEDEFVVEVMSTTFIARRVFEKVGRQFPEYVIKFASDDPRNEKNRAGPEELRVLEYFRSHPDETRWTGRIELKGRPYLAYLGAMRIEGSCLRCHGRPADAPQRMIELYGDQRGFDHQVGDVAGVDMIAIPMENVNAALAHDAAAHLLTTTVWLAALFGAILVAFRFFVARRLEDVTAHFESAAEQTEETPLASIPVQGKDEISVLARSYNALASRLRALHDSLEHRVRQRTADLTRANRALQDEIIERTRLESEILVVSSREQQRIGQELHDGLGQDLAGLGYLAKGLHQKLRAKNIKEAETAAELACAIPQVLRELRGIVKGLIPLEIDAEALIPALEALVTDVRESTGIVCRLECDAAVFVRDRETAVQMYRIAQEAVANAVKHAKPRKIVVRLEATHHGVELEVRDDGVGIRADMNASAGCGLRIMRYRAGVLGGSLDVHAMSEGGTTVKCVLPCETCNA